MTRTSVPTANASSWCAAPRALRNSTSTSPPVSATANSTPWPAWSCSSSAAYRGAGRPCPSAASNSGCCGPIGGASTACTSPRSASRPRHRECRALRRPHNVGAVGGGAGRGRIAAPGLRTLQSLAPGDSLSRLPDAAVAAAHAWARGRPGTVLWRRLFRSRHLVALHLDPRPRPRAGLAEPDPGAAGRGLHGQLLRTAGLAYGAFPARRRPLAPVRGATGGVAAHGVAARLVPVGLPLAVPRLFSDRHLAQGLRPRGRRLRPLRAAAAAGGRADGVVAGAQPHPPGGAGTRRTHLGARRCAGARGVDRAPRSAGAGSRGPGRDTAG